MTEPRPGTLLVLGTVRLPPENLDRARPVMAAMVAASRAERGCLDYGYAEDVVDRGLIHVRERWVDRAALDRHAMSAHIGAWRAAWPEPGIGDRDLWAYEAGEPQRL